ncbi:MAG: ABC transporter permease [Bacteroidales bacterium]|jgi:putative ABC transport system permease protein|nr:ABC transporter permease [Bacteroidales bacterium]
MIKLKLLRESLIFAFNELIVNKVRTFLSLLGITIGIFSVIAVFTIFDSMEIYLRDSINSLGSNVLFVQKWPWMENDLEWWKIINRDEPSLDDLDAINRRSELMVAASFMTGTQKTLKNDNNSMENIRIDGVSYDYPKIMSLEIESGRYFTELEANNGRGVALIGTTVAENLFPGEDPIGRNIKVGGYKTYVIGIMKKKGDDAFGNSPDETLLVPINYMRNFLNLHRTGGNTVAVMAKSNVTNDQLRDELTGILRSAHRIKPGEENDFAINETDVISKGFDVFFAIIGTIGWVIGGFSLLVGGFGIANIMFVSVKERVNIIGIQKAMGAKNYFILFQFLFEAIFLALIGGILGIIIVLLMVVIVNAVFDFGMVLTMGNIMLGVLVSSGIGLLSGFLPANQASKLNPVDAMRSLS